MAEIERWTVAMRTAYEWVWDAYEKGWGSGQTYNLYTRAGGQIRKQDCLRLWHVVDDITKAGERAGRLPGDMPLPAGSYTPVDFDYQRKFIMIAEVRYTDPLTGKPLTGRITVESDSPQSLNQVTRDVGQMIEMSSKCTHGGEYKIIRIWPIKRLKDFAE